MHHGRPGRFMCSCASQTFDQDFKNNKKPSFVILFKKKKMVDSSWKSAKNLIFRRFPLVKKGFADRNVQPLLSMCIYTRVFLVHSRLSDCVCRVQVRWVSWPIRNTNNIIKLFDSIGHCEKVESATSTNTSRWPGTFVYRWGRQGWLSVLKKEHIVEVFWNLDFWFSRAVIIKHTNWN